MQHLIYDVLIIGGGVAGSATALSLLQVGIQNIAIIEASHYDSPRIGESIPPDTRVLLMQLGLWEMFLADGHDICLGSCSAWGSNELGYNDFLLNIHGSAWHLDRQRFDKSLAHEAQRRGADLWLNTRLESSKTLKEDGFELHLIKEMQPVTIQARFVVDATGKHAFFARQRGATPRIHDRLIVMSAFFEIESFSQLTMLEAVNYGWWYAARLPNKGLVVAIASDPEIIKKKGLNTAAACLAHLKKTQHIAKAIGEAANLKTDFFPSHAASFILDKICADTWLAVGDAASAYDPIMSQGIYKAISSGIFAAKCINAHKNGDADALRQYTDTLKTQFNQYVHVRRNLYKMEKRWHTDLFWKRRQV